MDKQIKKKLDKKYRKELETLLAEKKLLEIKIEALTKIVKSIEAEKED